MDNGRVQALRSTLARLQTAVFTGFAILLFYSPTPGLAQTAPGSLPLLQANSLTYLGAFRVPANSAIAGRSPTRNGFDYAQSGLAFNPANNSLFINNHIYDSFTAEIGIPASITQSTTLAGMPVAPLLQNIADTSEGHLANVLANGAPTRSPSFGGLLVANGKLVGTSYEY